MNHLNFTNRQKIPVALIVPQFATSYPDLWRFTCPRMYKHTDRFQDYRLPAYLFGCILAGIRRGGIAGAPKEMKELALLLNLGGKYNFPTFFVEKDLLLAASNTTPPTKIDWQNMKMPFPFMNFILPKGAVTVGGEEVVNFLIGRVPAGVYSVPKTTSTVILDKPSLLMTAFTETGVHYRRSHTEPYSPGEELPDAVDGPYAAALSADDRSFSNLMARASFNLLLAMEARPELLDFGHKAGFHKKSGSEAWTPNVIGARYKIARPVPDSNGGAHASPRIHWRRGHFRDQPCGAGRAERKVIWIEPFLVGVKEKGH